MKSIGNGKCFELSLPGKASERVELEVAGIVTPGEDRFRRFAGDDS